MTRRKVKLEYITNDSSRRAAFKKRKKGLMKKVSELSTLCGINACAIVYGPYDRQPDLWPPSRMAVQRIISRFKEMPDMEQSKKMVSQEAYLRQRISRANDQLKKHSKENREREVTKIMFNVLTSTFTGTTPVWPSMRVMDLHDLSWVVDQYAKDVIKRSDTLKEALGIGDGSEVAAPPPPPPDVPAEGLAETEGGGRVQANAGMQRPPWFVELGNPQEPNVPFAGNELMLLPFGGNINNNNNPQNVVWPSNNNNNPQNLVWPNNNPFFP
ncbi:agamous-like MADS-box protein AGL80 [Syzygium oleosum]|uniref:agamous-like MADS-box protein AGL80 n=1 Tax=Syzygium oleosum TaxID=219896 RepID=UPI0011D277C9|nr:agamous-like MADS-box protein AGL80 [Syzygium oleosum]